MRWHVIAAVFWRNLQQYFSSVLGYLFIVVFVTCCAVITFSPQFFADNLANLDQLSRFFPLLLLIFIPAITMGVWSDEKRQGTDSILFTLPASDFDITLGKYLSVVAVYTIALLFSVTQIFALEFLGDPDWGVIATTYLGYWLAGVALIAVGMFASSLSNSATVAFILGALFCAVPILGGRYFGNSLLMERLGIDWNLSDFTLGLIPLSNVLYFVGLTIFMLYLNLVAISERRWKPSNKVELLIQYVIRGVCLAVVLASAVYLFNSNGGSASAKADLTAEKLYTLDPATISTLDKIKNDDQVIQVEAFVSDDLPRKFVNTRKQLLGILRQYAEQGGNNVEVSVFDVAANSRQATDARGKGIEPVANRSEEAGRIIEREVYMGVYLSSPERTVTIPFFEDSDSIEYQLSRSIATAYKRGPKPSLGVLETDAFFGGPEVEGQRLDWAYTTTLDDLKKDYDVKLIEASRLSGYLGSETESNGLKAPDVMLVADPASLDDQSMAALTQYIQKGHPTLILGDPLPFFWTSQAPLQLGILNAPQMPRVSPQSRYAQILSSSQMPKADNGFAGPLNKALGIEWNTGQTAYSLLDPHPNFRGDWPQERFGPSWPKQYGPYEKAFNYVKNQDDVEAINQTSPITAGLNELLMIYPGSISKSDDSKLTFEPLLTTGKNSGVSSWSEATADDRNFNQYTMSLTRIVKPAQAAKIDDDEHVLAARITGEGDDGVNVVFIADLDFVSDYFYQQQEALGQKLDNLSFLYNALDVLSGSDQFVSLRNRRAKPRTLTRLETIFDGFRSKKAKSDQAREEKLQAELEKEQALLDADTEKIQTDQSMGLGEKLQQTFQRASDSQRRFELTQARLLREKAIEDAKSKNEMQEKIASQESVTRWLTVLMAPLPALVLGGIVLWFRKTGEQKDIADDRRVT
jgi:ABC-2 type transport system permease protein